MKDTLRQIAVIVTVLVTITINVLANALPINGLNTGEISDRFQVYFVPAGYVFSIWGLIYIGLIAYAIFQALPSQKQNPRLQATGWLVVLGGVANSLWIFLWHYEQFPATLAAMLVLLGTLIGVYLRLGTGRTKGSAGETWAVRVPFSIYLGWITVATVANVTDVLDFVNWNGFGIAPRNLDGDRAGGCIPDRSPDELHPPRHCLCRRTAVGAGRDCVQVPGCRHRHHCDLGYLCVGCHHPGCRVCGETEKGLNTRGTKGHEGATKVLFDSSQ